MKIARTIKGKRNQIRITSQASQESNSVLFFFLKYLNTKIVFFPEFQNVTKIFNMYKPISLVSVKFIFETAIDLDKMYKNKQTKKDNRKEIS